MSNIVSTLALEVISPSSFFSQNTTTLSSLAKNIQLRGSSTHNNNKSSKKFQGSFRSLPGQQAFSNSNNPFSSPSHYNYFFSSQDERQKMLESSFTNPNANINVEKELEKRKEKGKKHKSVVEPYTGPPPNWGTGIEAAFKRAEAVEGVKCAVIYKGPFKKDIENGGDLDYSTLSFNMPIRNKDVVTVKYKVTTCDDCSFLYFGIVNSNLRRYPDKCNIGNISGSAALYCGPSSSNLCYGRSQSYVFDKAYNLREGDVLAMEINMAEKTLKFSKDGVPIPGFVKGVFAPVFIALTLCNRIGVALVSIELNNPFACIPWEKCGVGHYWSVPLRDSISDIFRANK